VDAIRAWIGAGDVYQVNLSRRLESAPVSAHQARQLYAALCRESGAPFDALIDTGRVQVISNSPERFLRVERGEVETCPIKGTRPRGRTADEDRALARALCASPKDRAEHVMIVDLERNDLGRVCATGSVAVPRLAELRSFATVHHLVSSVRGRLRDPLALEALIAATFPGGSITGAPKLRAMQIIDCLEAGERGVYTGAIGRFDAAGGVDLSIAIRTAVVCAERLSLRVGSGIVADSDPELELAETRDKAQAFRRFCEVQA
jgi:anthranilate/para-aminobenzoate synthase component I